MAVEHQIISNVNGDLECLQELLHLADRLGWILTPNANLAYVVLQRETATPNYSRTVWYLDYSDWRVGFDKLPEILR